MKVSLKGLISTLGALEALILAFESPLEYQCSSKLQEALGHGARTKQFFQQILSGIIAENTLLKKNF